MAMFTWDDSYSVNIGMIDSHHKRLFDILNKLYDLMLREGSKEDREIVAIIDELIDYTNFHFSEEEKMMEKFDYPELSSHKLLHREFISKMGEYQTKAKNGMAIFVVTQVADTGIDWLKSHILTVDNRYKVYMEERGISA